MPSIFSLGRRKRRPTVSETQSTASLPNLDPSEPGLGSWPESLVDAATLSAPQPSADEFGQTQSAQTTPTKAGATRSAFAVQGGTISFHRPFRGPPPSAFNGSASVPAGLTLDNTKPRFDPSSIPQVPQTPTHKRPRAPVQTFNLLVAGAKGSGKTSLLNLLLSTSRLPPAVAKHPQFPPTPTREMVEKKVEVEQGLRRYMFSVTDTPGLELAQGRELAFDRQVQELVRYQEKRMGEALVMESRVVRETVADQLVHICIYLVNPASVLPRASPQEPKADPILRMHPGDMLAIRRLSARYHVLPLISKADTLTDRQLRRVKEAVRRDVANLEGGAGWGVFAFPTDGQEPEEEKAGKTNGNGHHAQEDGDSDSDSDSDDDEPQPGDRDGQTTPTPSSKRRSIIKRVIHIRPTSALKKQPKLRRARSLSRARPSADSSDSDTPTMSTPAEEKRELGSLLPWGVVAPEEEEDDLPTPTADSEGKEPEHRWVRKYRWGEIDVLNKAHCDFWALRRAVLGVYFKVLKNDTRRVLYERFRTEKLLVRRATRAMSEDDRKKIYGI